MTERTRQTVLGVFLAGVLAVTVGAVGLYAGHRQKQATRLGMVITSRQFGFSVRMPEGWEQVPVNMNLFGPSLAYMRKLEPRAGRDPLSNQWPQRHIFFLITPPKATAEKILDPLVKLVRVLDISDNYFDGYQVQWSGPIRPDKYQRRRGGISVWFYQRRRLGYPLQLGIYEQITAEKQVFWCVIVGNNQLNAADEALLDAVPGSFEKINE